MKVTIRGVDDVNKLLTEIAPRQAVNIMRATVHDIAREVAKDAKLRAPRDSSEMADTIKARRENPRKTKRGFVASTVRVGNGQGRNNDQFYWRFVEYGEGPDGWAQGFFLRAIENMRSKLQAQFLRSFGKKWEAAVNRARKRNGG